jgi:hypothetical protein
MARLGFSAGPAHSAQQLKVVEVGVAAGNLNS